MTIQSAKCHNFTASNVKRFAIYPSLYLTEATRPITVKVKVWILDIALLTWKDSWTAALHNPWSGSWLAWANGTAARYAAIHCPRWTSGHAAQHDRHTTAQSAALGLHPVARRLLLINRPRRDGTLSWRWYTAAAAGTGSRTHDLAIARSGTVPLGPAPYHSARHRTTRPPRTTEMS